MLLVLLLANVIFMILEVKDRWKKNQIDKYQKNDDESFDDATYAAAEVDFFDDLVRGTISRIEDVDAAVSQKLTAGWNLSRLDKTLKAVLRVGCYELMARSDVPTPAVISEYVEVAKAFDAMREAGFINGVLDAIAHEVRG